LSTADGATLEAVTHDSAATGIDGGVAMTQMLVGQQPADYQELARQVRSHPFVDGPTRKLVRSWIGREPAQEIPWTLLAKPLGACRVALVSSAGIARHDQPPFDQDLERRDPWWSDQSWRPIPLGTSEADVGIYHLHIDPRFGHQDLDCVLPLRRLQELATDGLVGQVAATQYSFMGYILQPTELLSSTAPAIAARMAEEAVDVALLVPV
jgi:D-proline reductase (dithiol) PrdB